MTFCQFWFSVLFSPCVFLPRQVISGSTPFTSRTSRRTRPTHICSVIRPSTCMPSGPPHWSTYCLLSSCWAAAASSCASASVAAPTLTTTSRCVSIRAPQDEWCHRRSPCHKPLAITDCGREVRFLTAVDCNTDRMPRRALAASLLLQNLLHNLKVEIMKSINIFFLQNDWYVYSLRKSMWPYKYTVISMNIF